MINLKVDTDPYQGSFHTLAGGAMGHKLVPDHCVWRSYPRL